MRDFRHFSRIREIFMIRDYFHGFDVLGGTTVFYSKFARVKICNSGARAGARGLVRGCGGGSGIPDIRIPDIRIPDIRITDIPL